MDLLKYASYVFVVLIIVYIVFTYVFKKQLSTIGVGGLRSFLTLNSALIGIGIAGLFFIAYFFYSYYTSTNLKLNSSTYSANHESSTGGGSASSNRSATLLFFFADWCPHCKAAKPIWNDLKEEYESKTVNGYRIVFTEIDCSEETPEVESQMNRYKIEGYPTIKMVKDGQVIEFDAKPTKENLHKFLNTVL